MFKLKDLGYLSLILGLLFSSFSLLASQDCSSLLALPELTVVHQDPFENYNDLEQRIDLLNSELNSRFSSDQEMNSRLTEISKSLETEVERLQAIELLLLDGEGLAILEVRESHSRLNDIRSRLITALTTESNMTSSEATTPKLRLLDEIIQDPNVMEAEKPYLVTLVNGDSLNIIISHNIEKSVFQNPQRTRVVRRSLRKIRLGIFSGDYSGDGIIRMFHNNSVVEIRASGKDGNFRFFGYLENGNLHIVHHTNSSDHSGAINMRNIRQVLNIKDSRGH